MALKPQQLHKHVTRQFAAATYGLIALNIAIFIGSQVDPNRVIQQYGLVPTHLSLLNMFTALFIHSDKVHLAANVLFLWAFGRSVEFAMGGIEYLIFYIGSGFVSSIVHVAIVAVFALDSKVPVVGASGAIAGILGVAAIRFHRRKFHLGKIEIPALLILFTWLLVQAVLGFVSLYITTYHVRTVQVSLQSIGYWSHFGGFVFGMAVAQLTRMDILGHKDHLCRKISSNLDRGALLDALRACDELVRYDPKDASAHAEIASVWALLNDREQSVISYQKAIGLYLKTGEGERAWELLSEMHRYWPGSKLDPSTLFRLGSFLEESGRYREAAESLVKLASESPDTIEAQMALLKSGHIQKTRLNHPQSASDTLNKLIQTYPHSDFVAEAERLLS